MAIELRRFRFSIVIARRARFFRPLHSNLLFSTIEILLLWTSLVFDWNFIAFRSLDQSSSLTINGIQSTVFAETNRDIEQFRLLVIILTITIIISTSPRIEKKEFRNGILKRKICADFFQYLRVEK